MFASDIETTWTTSILQRSQVTIKAKPVRPMLSSSSSGGVPNERCWVGGASVEPMSRSASGKHKTNKWLLEWVRWNHWFYSSQTKLYRSYDLDVFGANSQRLQLVDLAAMILLTF